MTILLIALIIAVIGSYLFFKGGYQISSGDHELINKIAAMDPVEHVYGVTGEVHISDDLMIHYNQIPPSSEHKGTVLLVNGLAQTMLDWPAYILDGLTDAGYEIIRMDNRDVGNSSWVEDWGKGNYYKLSEMAADAIAVLDHLKVDQAHVIGVSMGGMISQTLVLDYPDRFLSLSSLLSTGYFYDPELTQVTPAFRLGVGRIYLKYSLNRSAINSMKAQLSIYHLLHGDASYEVNKHAVLNRAYYEVSRRKGYNPKASRQHGVAIAKSGSRYDRLGQISIPTLILHGTGDPLILVEHAQKYHRLIPNAKKCIIDGMGHDLPEKFQEQIMTAIFNNISTTTH